ncbi:hypothetical protein GGS24DRAFT_350447 [Hypoxylon argillaceum]|nr:hypothetical protein GGS24DRAFT_350447 [Hypoxylon argillaceum]
MSSRTTPQVSPPISSDNTFSRANVFGLFLTLALCLLSQSYGSLLYKKPKNVIGRSIYFFWRLNPLACVLEAFLLAIAVADGVVTAIIARRRNSSEDAGGFWCHLRATFRAITLLRGHGRLPDHYKTIGNDGATASTVSPHSTASRNPTYVSDAIAEATTRDHENRATAPLLPNGPEASANTSDGPYTDDTSPDSSLDIADRQSTRTAALYLALPIRSPAQVEEGRGDDSYSESTVETAHMTRPRFGIGRNFILRAEYVVDLIATVAVVVVVIKLAAVTIPLHIRISAWFMVADWFAIQALILVSPRRERNDVDDAYVIRRAVELESRLFQPLTWFFLSLLLLPLFGYFTHVFFFQARAISVTWRWAFLGIWCILTNLVDPLIWKYIPMAITSSCLRRGRQDSCSDCAIRLATEISARPKPVIIFVVIAKIISLVLMFVVGMYLGSSLAHCIYDDQPAWRYLVLPFVVMPTLFWAWFLVPADPFVSRGKGAEWIRGVCLCSNIITTILFFTGAMLLYDATGTYKPSWVEWLGKLKRILEAQRMT